MQEPDGSQPWLRLTTATQANFAGRHTQAHQSQANLAMPKDLNLLQTDSNTKDRARSTYAKVALAEFRHPIRQNKRPMRIMKSTHSILIQAIAAACAWGAIGLAEAASVAFTDTIDGTKTFNVASSPLGGVGTCGIQTGAHSYQTRAVTANYTGAHTFTVTGSTATVTTGFNDPFLAIYAGSFNPANPTANLVGCDDDSGGAARPAFTANLTNGQTYVLVATTFDNNAAFGGTAPQGTVVYSGDSGGGNPALTVGSSGSGGVSAPTLPAAGLAIFAGLLAVFGSRLLRRRR